MPILELSTMIRAPRERVFDLARSIDAHQDTTGHTEERAVGGVTTGLIGMNDEVTWEARHFGVRQRLTVRVTAFDPPQQFQDIMVSGAFKRMVHDHFFAEHPMGTLMRDRFEFEAPLGFLGRIAEWVFLTSYLRRFLARRNELLKHLAESPAGDRYLGTFVEMSVFQTGQPAESRSSPVMALTRRGSNQTTNKNLHTKP